MFCTHWMNQPNMRLWVDGPVWNEHVRVCVAATPPLDPKVAVGIIHIDAHPVHLSQELRDWLKKYPQFRLIYVPANCTSELQCVDVVLNKPFKNYMARDYTRWMVSKVDEETEKGTSMKDIKFNELVTQAAGLHLDGW